MRYTAAAMALSPISLGACRLRKTYQRNTSHILRRPSEVNQGKNTRHRQYWLPINDQQIRARTLTAKM